MRLMRTCPHDAVRERAAARMRQAFLNSCVSSSPDSFRLTGWLAGWLAGCRDDTASALLQRIQQC